MTFFCARGLLLYLFPILQCICNTYTHTTYILQCLFWGVAQKSYLIWYISVQKTQFYYFVGCPCQLNKNNVDEDDLAPNVSSSTQELLLWPIIVYNESKCLYIIHIDACMGSRISVIYWSCFSSHRNEYIGKVWMISDNYFGDRILVTTTWIHSTTFFLKKFLTKLASFTRNYLVNSTK